MEVQSSFLRTPRFNTGTPHWFYVDPYKIETAFLARNHCGKLPEERPYSYYIGMLRNNYAALYALATTMKCDTIYWFCDMDDEVDFDAAKVLLEILEPKGVKLYLHTMARNPSRDLATVVERSGGRVIRKKPN